jgi:hypothetical protein
MGADPHFKANETSTSLRQRGVPVHGTFQKYFLGSFGTVEVSTAVHSLLILDAK